MDSVVCRVRVRVWDVHVKIKTSTLKGKQKGNQKGTKNDEIREQRNCQRTIEFFLLHFSSVFNPHEKETL